MKAKVGGHLVACAGAVVLALAGCGGNPGKVAQETSNLKPLAVLYGQYAGQHRGQNPPSEAQFKAFIKSLPADRLAAFDVQDVETLFTSTRDKKPYVIKYGGMSAVPGPGSPAVIAYEQEGVGGKRMFASSLGAIEEVDEAAFKAMVPDAK